MKESKCILWTKACNEKGYGVTWKYGKIYKAHRAAYEKHHSIKLTSTQYVLHTCDTPSCVNPEHLYIGTQKDNMQDRKERTGFHQTQGSKHPSHKLKEKDIYYILNSHCRNKDLAKYFSVDPSLISRIRSGKKWKHISKGQLERGYQVSN